MTKMPKIEVISGPMFCGKSSDLIRRVNRLKYARADFIVFKPKIDIRYAESEVVTHEKVSVSSVAVSSAAEILEYCAQHPVTNIIAIDEAQFFPRTESPNIVDVCVSLKIKGYRIIITGLDMDSNGKPFGLMPELFSIADDVLKLKSVCSICGRDASMTYKLEQNDSVVELGSSDKYQPRCFSHWVNPAKNAE
jgi:thymidine kinase